RHRQGAVRRMCAPHRLMKGKQPRFNNWLYERFAPPGGEITGGLMSFYRTAASRSCWRSIPPRESPRPVSFVRLLRLQASATPIFSLVSSPFLAPEQKVAQDEFWPKELPFTESTCVQRAATPAAAFA